ncbi:MAG: hypothetical protein ACK4RK_21765 [Gemmataceae bacterium]
MYGEVVVSDQAATQRLLSGTVKENDQAIIAAIERVLRQRLKIEWATAYTDGQVALSVPRSIARPPATAEQVAASRRIVRAATSPAPPHMLAEALSKLHLMTRFGGKMPDWEPRCALYVEKLAEWPADVAMEAIDGWSGAAFPAWGDLLVRLGTIGAMRQRLVGEVLTWEANQATADDGQPKTAAERVRVQWGLKRLREIMASGATVAEADQMFAAMRREFCGMKQEVGE